jgi:hypothetical protein
LVAGLETVALLVDATIWGWAKTGRTAHPQKRMAGVRIDCFMIDGLFF